MFVALNSILNKVCPEFTVSEKLSELNEQNFKKNYAPHTRVIIDSDCHLIPSPQVRRSGTYKWCCWGFATCHGTPIMPEAIINRVYRCVQVCTVVYSCTVGWWYSDAKQVWRWWWGVAAGEREVAWTTRLMASLWKLSEFLITIPHFTSQYHSQNWIGFERNVESIGNGIPT